MASTITQNIGINAYVGTLAFIYMYMTVTPSASLIIQSNRTIWSTSDLPNPKRRFLCRGVKSVPSYFCDPEGLLEYDEALSIQRRLHRIHMSSRCSCDREMCERNRPYSGYEVVVILVSNIISADRSDVDTYIDTKESLEEVADEETNGRFPLEPKSRKIPTNELANAVLGEKWKLGHCGDYAVLTYATVNKICVFTHGSKLTTLYSSNCHLSMLSNNNRDDNNNTNNPSNNATAYNNNNTIAYKNNDIPMSTNTSDVRSGNILRENMTTYEELNKIISFYESQYFKRANEPKVARIYAAAASSEPTQKRGFSLYVLAPILIFASFILIVLFLVITDKYFLPWYRNRLRYKDEKMRYSRKLDQMNCNDSKMTDLHKEEKLLEAESVVDADEGWWWDESGQKIRHESGDHDKLHH